MPTKSYVVTGAANGIGKELVLLLSQQGHRVIGLDIAEPDYPIDTYVNVDLSDPASITNAVSAIAGNIDGLCNCSGLPPRDGLEAKILDVNFLGTRELTNQLAPKINEGGSVVNLASRAGARWGESVDQVKRLATLDLTTGSQNFITDENIDPVRAYDLSKEAVILWTMACSEGFTERGIRINSVSPGAIETRILNDFANAFGERMSKNVARAGRAGTPQEVANLAAFLLSHESHWIKGTDIGIDGGMSAFNISDALSLNELL